VHLKSYLIIGMTSLERDNLVVFHCLSAFEILPDKRVALGGSGLIKWGTLVCNFFFLTSGKISNSLRQ
jgi:hypothetical protein